MNRRQLILSGAALALTGAAPPSRPARFSIEVSGNGPDVVLIPGLTMGRDVWTGVVRALPGYRYHLIQVAGFAGEAARGNGRGAILAPLADEIARYIEQSGLRRPAIVGHSMGGTLAMMIGAARPGLVGRIMVVDMLPAPAALLGQSPAGAAPFANSLGGLMATQTGRSLFGSLMTSFSPPNSGARTSDPGVVARALNELASIDLTGTLPRIRAPLTVVYGAPVREAAAALDRSFARAYAGASGVRLIRVDRSGHMVMFDQPARFYAAVREFLRR